MAGINYKRLAKTMARMTTENGKPVHLSRPGKTERIDGVDVHTPGTSKDLVMTQTSFTREEMASGRVLTGDVKLATGPDFAIAVGDLLEFDGMQLRVIDPGTIKPGTVVIGYKVWARSGK